MLQFLQFCQNDLTEFSAWYFLGEKVPEFRDTGLWRHKCSSKLKLTDWSWPCCLLRTATPLSAWWLDWTLRNHILSNQWIYHRIRWVTCYKQISKLTHRLRFSRSSWLHWWILPKNEGENNINSSQILSENQKGRLLSNSFYEDITLIQKPDKDIIRKLISPLSLTNIYISPVMTSIKYYVEVLARARKRNKRYPDGKGISKKNYHY